MSVLRQPERKMSSSPRCDRPVQGDGIMSYHCTLPQGHTSEPPQDPEPCYAVESGRSARAWDAWKRRREMDGQRPEDIVIECPACGEGAMVVTVLGGVCENCGEKADIMAKADVESAVVDPEQRTALVRPWREGDPLVTSDAETPTSRPRTPVSEAQYPEGQEYAAQNLRTREGDQRLPDGDESIPDDQSLLIADIEARRKVGISRYGQGHRPFNGRNTLQDWYEEQLDGLVYARSIVRMAEADRAELVSAVSNAIRSADGDHTMGAGALAEVAVDRIMGWVTAQRMDGGVRDLIEQVTHWAVPGGYCGSESESVEMVRVDDLTRRDGAAR